MKNLFQVLIFFSVLIANSCSEGATMDDDSNSAIQIKGAMKKVMRTGQLQGTFNLASISNEKHIYGLGPIEYLKGELLIVDGKSYASTVTSDSTMSVEETFQVKAPFFVYTSVENWEEFSLPNEVQTIPQLETYLNKVTKNLKKPFVFKLSGLIKTATIHVVNLPEGTKVRSHEEAHQGLVDYNLINEPVDIIGFFSTKHQGVFTHHDSYLHMHLITADKMKMGHLDNVKFKKDAIKLFLPNKH